MHALGLASSVTVRLEQAAAQGDEGEALLLWEFRQALRIAFHLTERPGGTQLCQSTRSLSTAHR